MEKAIAGGDNPREVLLRILMVPLSKKALAFEAVVLEPLSLYTDWAKSLDSLELVNPEITALADLKVKGEPNYFEVVDQLRRIVKALGIISIVGQDAVSLYTLGTIEDLANEESNAEAILQQLAELGIKWPQVQPLVRFRDIFSRLQWLDVNEPREAYDTLLKSFIRSAAIFVEFAQINVVTAQDGLHLEVRWQEQ